MHRAQAQAEPDHQGSEEDRVNADQPNPCKQPDPREDEECETEDHREDAREDHPDLAGDRLTDPEGRDQFEDTGDDRPTGCKVDEEERNRERSSIPQQWCCVAERIAVTIAKTPSTKQNAPKIRMRTMSVSLGQASATRPNRIAKMPRTTGSHQCAAMRSIIAWAPAGVRRSPSRATEPGSEVRSSYRGRFGLTTLRPRSRPPSARPRRSTTARILHPTVEREDRL